jgi:hypothetical protein
METATIEKEVIYINKTKILLEDIEENKGRITILDPKYGKLEMFWGAMGGNLKDFLLYINHDYFCDKLLGYESSQVFDVKKTFKELRKFIRTELDLPWYKHMDFQKNLRQKLNYFQDVCYKTNSEDYFVQNFNYHLGTTPDFYLIENRFEKEIIEKNFKSIEEPWHFINTKDSEKAKWLKKLHDKIKNKLIKNGR